MSHESINDRFFVTNGRKDWKTLLESRKNAAKIKAEKNKGARLGHQGKDVKGKVILSKVEKIDQKRIKDGKIEEDGAGVPGGAAAAAGPGTTTGAVAVFPARMGIGTTKRPLNEDGDEISEPNTFSKKADSISKRKEKLEKQLQDMDAEMQRLMKLEDLQKQNEQIIAQLDAIKEEMEDVKNEKTSTVNVGEIKPEGEESEEGTEEKEENGEETEESEEKEEDEESEDDEKPEPHDMTGIFNKVDSEDEEENAK